MIKIKGKEVARELCAFCSQGISWMGISANPSTRKSINIAEMRSMMRSKNTMAEADPKGRFSLSKKRIGRTTSPIRNGSVLIKKKLTQRI